MSSLDVDEKVERRHVRTVPDEPASAASPVCEQLAVVAGVNAYDFKPLTNAAADARALGDLLRQDFEFRLLPSGQPLIDGDAKLDDLRTAIDSSLAEGRPESRWLFYFAGHGDVVDEKGYLLPADAREKDPKSWLELEWLIDRALSSRYAEILIVLDMCYAGRALMKPDVQPWLEPGADDSRGTVQLLAAGGPRQTVLDRGGGGHSIFSRCLLEALEGEAGVHEEDGAVRFTPLLEHLDVAVERRLEALHRSSKHQQLLGVTVRAGLKGTVKGDFRFQSRGPRLPPATVRGLQARDSLVRRKSFAALAPFSQAEPADWPLDQRLAWNLPLAMNLALRELPRGDLQDVSTDLVPPMQEPDWRVRRQVARSLGELGELGREPVVETRAERGHEPLLHLAIRDPDSSVRREAVKALARVLDDAEQLRVGERLAKLGRGASMRVRRLLWNTRVCLRSHRSELALGLRAWATMTRAFLMLGEGWRWIVRNPRRRTLAMAPVSIIALAYLVLGSSYYTSTDRFDNVVIRRGMPGYEALPGIGGTVVFTDRHATDFVDRTAATEERLVGSWWIIEDGAFDWGRRLADHLRPANAGLELWRLGDSGAALDRLRRSTADGESASVRVAAYLAIQSAALADPIMELVIEALAVESTHAVALQALEILQPLRPEAAATVLEALTAGLDEMSRDEMLAVLEAISVLGADDPALVESALRHTVAALGTADARTEHRMIETLERLVDAHPELSVSHVDDLVDLAQRPSADRAAVLDLLKTPADLDFEARRHVMVAALEHLESDGEPGRIAALGLLRRVLDGQPSWIEECVPILTTLAGDADANIVLAVSDLVADLPADLAPREVFAGRLRKVVRDGSSYKLRIRALEKLVELTGGDAAAIDVLRATTTVPDTDVRSRAVGLLVSLALDGQTDSEPVGPVLIRALGDQDPGIRQEAAQGILLLTPSESAEYEKAFSEVFEEIYSEVRGWNASQAIGKRFRRSTADASVRFGNRLLSAASTQPADKAHLVFRTFEALVTSQPAILPALLPGMTELLAASDETDLAWQMAWFLRRLRVEGGVDLTEVNRRFLGLLESPSISDRIAAVQAFGVTVGSTEEALPVLRRLGQTIARDESSVVERSARTLEWLANSQLGLIDELLPLLWQGLADPRPTVRVAFARALSEAAEADPPSLSEPPIELEEALGDPHPEVRRRAARTLELWGRERSEALRSAVPWIEDRLAQETELLIRLQLAKASVVLDGDDAAAVDRVFDLAQEGLLSPDEAVQQAAVVALGGLAEVHPAQARRVADLFMVRRDQLETSLRGLVVLVLRDAGMTDMQGGKAAIRALQSYLVEDDDFHVRWSALVNGLKYVAAAHPVLASEVVDMLEDFLTDGNLDLQDRLASTVWEVWVELAVEPASKDLDFLWRRLTSPSRFYRRAALETLVRLVAERPELLPDVEAGLEGFRRSVRPQVRIAASKAAESIEVLRWAEAEVVSQSGEAWDEALEWASKLGIQTAVQQAQRAD